MMNLLYEIYFAIPNLSSLGLFGKAIDRLFILALKRIFDLIMPAYYNKTSGKADFGLNTIPRKESYIVSLTSYPARIDTLWITIETILRQSFKPDKIILWLAEEQFPDRKLPESLIKLKLRGLDVEFCEDLKSHKKYFYCLIKYPDSNIITLDDDLYYHKDVLKNVVELHKKYPGHITANRAHKITFSNGKINPYRSWKHEVNDTVPSHLLVATGGAGALYSPGSLHEEVHNKDILQKLCLHADDLWLKVMELKNNRKIVTNRKYNKSFASVGKTQKEKLVSLNVIQGGNDEQLNNLLRFYRIDLLKYLE